MTKDDLIKLVTEKKDEAESYYLENGPDKHEQEDYYHTGVNVVDMNVSLLVDWLDNQEGGLCDDFNELSKAERREVWEASGFHFGIYGYDQHDADFWWEHETQD